VKKRSPLLFVGAGLAVVLVLGVAAVAVAVSRGDRASGPLAAGHCVDTAFGMDEGNRIPPSSRVECDDSKAKAKVLKVTQTKTASVTFGLRSEPDCPQGTDGVTNV